MKTKVLAFAAILFMSCCSTALAQWPHNTYGNQTAWEIEVGTRILDRPGTDIPLSLVTSNPTNVTVFNANDATDLEMNAGAEFRFLKTTCYDGQWELRGYFNNWDIYEPRSGDLRSTAFVPGPLMGFNPTRFDYTYTSDLASIELNYKRAVRPGVTLLGGPRFISLTEFVDVDTDLVNPTIPNTVVGLRTETHTENYMPGVGFGVEFRRPIVRELFFIGSIKGAILADVARTNTTSRSRVNGVPVNTTTVFDDREVVAAGIGEISARLHYDLAPGTISLYAGYEALWLDGVAVAPAQVFQAAGPSPALHTSTTAFAHGLSLGGMLRF